MVFRICVCLSEFRRRGRSASLTDVRVRVLKSGIGKLLGMCWKIKEIDAGEEATIPNLPTANKYILYVLVRYHT